MSEQPDVTLKSHIAGKNATLRLYPDRVEWETEARVNTKLLVATMGMSALVGPAGIKTRKGAGIEMIPMRQVTSVTTRRDSMVNDLVTIVTAGNTLEARVSRREAEQVRAYVLAHIG